VIESLRVDEDLEWAPLLVRGALVQYDVVDRDVHRVVGHRRLDLVRRADEHLGALELLVHPDDVGFASLGLGGRCNLRLLLVLGDSVFDDLFVDGDFGHGSSQSLP